MILRLDGLNVDVWWWSFDDLDVGGGGAERAVLYLDAAAKMCRRAVEPRPSERYGWTHKRHVSIQLFYGICFEDIV